MIEPKIDHERATSMAASWASHDETAGSHAVVNLARAYLDLRKRHRKLVLESRELAEHWEHGLRLHDAGAQRRFRAALAAEGGCPCCNGKGVISWNDDAPLGAESTNGQRRETASGTATVPTADTEASDLAPAEEQ